jgi:hypothetical protein
MRTNHHGAARAAATLSAGLVLFAAGCLAPVAADETLWAQDRGFRLGLATYGNGISAVKPPVESGANDLYLEEGGGGMSLMVGYSFSPLFALCATMSGADHETNRDNVDAVYSSFFIEGQFRFLRRERVRPYLIAGLGGAALSVDGGGYDSETNGGGMVFGAGLLWNLTRYLMLDAALRVDAISWDQIDFTRELPGGGKVPVPDPIEKDGGSGRLQVGLTWEF